MMEKRLIEVENPVKKAGFLFLHFLCWSAIVITPTQQQQKPPSAEWGGFAFATEAYHENKSRAVRPCSMILHIYLDKFRIRGGGLAKCPGATEGGAEFARPNRRGKPYAKLPVNAPQVLRQPYGSARPNATEDSSASSLTSI
jgi:hypothetical protein